MMNILFGKSYRVVFRVFSKKIFTLSQEVSSIGKILLEKPEGKILTIQGWVYSVRKLGKNIFLDVKDGSCFKHLQIVYAKDICHERPQWGSSVKITGKTQKNKRGDIELVAEKLDVVGKCDVTDNFPFTPKQKQSLELYRQFLHFRPKIDYFDSIIRIRDVAKLKIHQYFHENLFINIDTPILTSGNCEGGAETFSVKPTSKELILSMKKKEVQCENAFFDSPAYLTVSGQLHLELLTRSISKVYTFNPCFRAENSKSRLHLSEFYMVEAEEAFVSDLKYILLRIEDLIKQVTSYLINNHSQEIEFILQYNNTNLKEHMDLIEKLITEPFLVMTFNEAKSKIKSSESKMGKSINTGYLNLTKEEEFFLVKSNNNLPVFIVDWPKQEKPFYMKESAENNDLVQGVDLLVPNVGELCGGGLREDRYDVLMEKLKSINFINSMQWYLDLRKFGNVPTGGFGLGFERFLQFLLNIQNIKDVIPFPRWPHELQL